MAKQINVGVGGVVKKVKEVPIGIGGVVKKAKKGVCGIGGVVKEFFTSGLNLSITVTNDNEGKIRFGNIFGNKKFYLNTGGKNRASIRIYGDFAGKKISISTGHDTDNTSGYVYGCSADDEVITTFVCNGDGYHTTTKTADQTSGLAYFRISVNSTVSKAHTIGLDYLKVDDVDIVPELNDMAIEMGYGI